MNLLRRSIFSGPRSVVVSNSFRLFATDIAASKIQVERTKNPKPKLPNEQLVFGQTTSDHMLVVDWHKGDWDTPQIVPYGPFQMDPASSVLHYALECFEGMKAYKDKDGKIRLFRPDLNLKRFHRSSVRMGLPSFNQEELLQCIKELVKVDQDWIPEEDGYSLYLRPTMISTHATLGVAPPDSAKCFVITCPVGPYYKTGFAAVSLLADERYVRAWPGGTGWAKCGGNYAPGIMPQREAAKQGYSQILWLYGPEHYVTEVGTMNVFFLWTNKNGEKELVTHPLDDLVLPGVTRQSTIELCREWGIKVTERPYTMGEVAEAVKENRVIEAFGTGTAAIVSPIKNIHYKGEDLAIPLDPANPSSQAGPVASKLMNSILDIQYGRTESPWSVIVE